MPIKSIGELTREEVLADPRAPEWIKDALSSPLLPADPIDAANQGEALASILRGEWRRSMLRAHESYRKEK